MLYNPSIERDFIDRTLKIIRQYEKHVKPCVPREEYYDVTLLINCLLGLLVLPQALTSGDKIPGFVERWYKTLPKELNVWGLKAEYIEDAGYEPEQCSKCGKRVFNPKHKINRDRDKLTLREVIKNMRHSTAHFSIDAPGGGEEIEYVEFSNESEFKAKIPVNRLKTFVTKLAKSVRRTLKGSKK